MDLTKIKEKVKQFLQERGSIHPRVSKAVEKNIDLVSEKILELSNERLGASVNFALTSAYSNKAFIKVICLRAKRTTSKHDEFDFELRWANASESYKIVKLEK